jgi:outer membrane protein OmpA-like peptidoglycan-associated protein
LEHFFGPEEAIILKRGNDLVIRVFALDFVERGGNVEVQHAYRLNRVQDILKRFPASKITAEGHTYIYSTAQENLMYSRERAAMVKRYLRENLQIRQPIVALGFGNTSPIPSEELTNGYIRNDRIDIVITPRE